MLGLKDSYLLDEAHAAKLEVGDLSTRYPRPSVSPLDLTEQLRKLSSSITYSVFALCCAFAKPKTLLPSFAEIANADAAVWSIYWRTCEIGRRYQVLEQGLESIDAYYTCSELERAMKKKDYVPYASQTRIGSAGSLVRGMEIEFRCGSALRTLTLSICR
jgi:hypothetical protein